MKAMCMEKIKLVLWDMLNVWWEISSTFYPFVYLIMFKFPCEGPHVSCVSWPSTGFLQSKDPLQSVSSHKTSAQAITSLFSHNLRLGKRKKAESDPTKKFIRELHSDLEMVYVGQMCLSWEFLQWQYEKALELWESDPRGIRRYNEVAGEFQQFQVLMQRFIENEPFQGPRVQNYVKNRCVLRNLLQVPVIRGNNPENFRPLSNCLYAGIETCYLIVAFLIILFKLTGARY